MSIGYENTKPEFIPDLDFAHGVLPIDIDYVQSQVLEHAPDSVERDKVGVSLKFIFCEHTPLSAPRVATLLEDCDVVVLENIGLDSFAAEWLGEHFTKAISSEPAPEGEYNFWSDPDNKPGEWFYDLLAELRGTNKRVVMIEKTKDDPVIDELDTLFAQANDNLADGFEQAIPNSELLKRANDLVKTWARYMAARNNKVVENLSDLISHSSDSLGKVGVVFGNVHTPISYGFGKKDIPSSREFVVNERRTNGLADSEKIRYPYEAQIVRELEHNPSYETPESLEKRLLLELTYAFMYFDEDDKSGSNARIIDEDNEISVQTIRHSVLDKMSDADVGDLLAKIDEVKNNHPIDTYKQKVRILLDETIEKAVIKH